MKTKAFYLLILSCVLFCCDQRKSPYYDQILKSATGQLRGVEIGTSVENVIENEDRKCLIDKIEGYLHYDYEINMGNTYTVTYDFSRENKLYEIEVAIFLDEIEGATLLFDNFSNYFNKKYGKGKKEAHGYLAWNTHSNISNNRVAISIINDSESYGYITIIIRDLDY